MNYLLNNLIRIVAALVIISAANAEQVVVITNNVNDLNPQRDTLYLENGRGVRLTAILNDGVDPFEMIGANFPVFLTISHRTDGFTNTITTSIEGTASNNYLRWRFKLPDVGQYEIFAQALFPSESIPVVHNYIINTAQPPVTISSALNIYYWGSNVASVTNGL